MDVLKGVIKAFDDEFEKFKKNPSYDAAGHLMLRRHEILEPIIELFFLGAVSVEDQINLSIYMDMRLHELGLFKHGPECQCVECEGSGTAAVNAWYQNIMTRD